MCIFCGVKVTALEVPGAGGTSLNMNLLFPLRLIFRVGALEGESVGDEDGFGAVSAV